MKPLYSVMNIGVFVPWLTRTFHAFEDQQFGWLFIILLASFQSSLRPDWLTRGRLRILSSELSQKERRINKEQEGKWDEAWCCREMVGNQFPALRMDLEGVLGGLVGQLFVCAPHHCLYCRRWDTGTFPMKTYPISPPSFCSSGFLFFFSIQRYSRRRISCLIFSYSFCWVPHSEALGSTQLRHVSGILWFSQWAWKCSSSIRWQYLIVW